MHCPVYFAVAEAGLPQGSMLQPASACRTRLQFATWSLFDEVDVQRSADCVYVVDSSDTAERLAASVPHASVYRVQPVVQMRRQWKWTPLSGLKQSNWRTGQRNYNFNTLRLYFLTSMV